MAESKSVYCGAPAEEADTTRLMVTDKDKPEVPDVVLRI
jgi:hypothetical protein